MGSRALALVLITSTDMFHYMMDYLLQPIKGQGRSPMSFSSESSLRRTSLSSSRPDFRPIHPEIIRRKLVTDFLEANSLPVNVPIHRSRSVSSKMVSASSLESCSWEGEEEEEWVTKLKERSLINKCKERDSEDIELMF